MGMEIAESAVMNMHRQTHIVMVLNESNENDVQTVM